MLAVDGGTSLAPLDPQEVTMSTTAWIVVLLLVVLLLGGAGYFYRH
jgi:hypothetical protein